MRSRGFLSESSNANVFMKNNKLETQGQKALKKKEFGQAADNFFQAFCESQLNDRKRWHLFCQYCWMFTSNKLAPSNGTVLENLNQVKENPKELPLVRVHATETRAWLMLNYYKDPTNACNEFKDAMEIEYQAFHNPQIRGQKIISGRHHNRWYGLDNQLDDVRERFVGDVLDVNMARIKWSIKMIEHDGKDPDQQKSSRAAKNAEMVRRHSHTALDASNDKHKKRDEKRSSSAARRRSLRDGIEGSEIQVPGSPKKDKKKHHHHKTSSSKHHHKSSSSDAKTTKKKHSEKKKKHSHKKKTLEKSRVDAMHSDETLPLSPSSSVSSEQDSSQMKVGELKRQLSNHGISPDNFLEKGEMVQALDQARASTKKKSSGTKRYTSPRRLHQHS